MPAERRLRILARLSASGAYHGETQRLCQVCADVTAVTGAGIMLMAGDQPRGSICTTDEVSATIERLQFDLAEGPCVDAYQLDEPVAEADLAADHGRWLAFTGAALAAGARAVFGYPLRVGTVRLGALNLYCDRPGAMASEQHADALAMADVAAEAVLYLQAGVPPGSLSAELEAGADFHYVVQQAAGMVAAQLEVTVGQALARLRAHAFGNGLPLRDVAKEVVDRRLRFVADDDVPPPG